MADLIDLSITARETLERLENPALDWWKRRIVATNPEQLDYLIQLVKRDIEEQKSKENT